MVQGVIGQSLVTLMLMTKTRSLHINIDMVYVSSHGRLIAEI